MNSSGEYETVGDASYINTTKGVLPSTNLKPTRCNFYQKPSNSNSTLKENVYTNSRRPTEPTANIHCSKVITVSLAVATCSLLLAFCALVIAGYAVANLRALQSQVNALPLISSSLSQDVSETQSQVRVLAEDVYRLTDVIEATNKTTGPPGETNGAITYIQILLFHPQSSYAGVQ